MSSIPDSDRESSSKDLLQRQTSEGLDASEGLDVTRLEKLTFSVQGEPAMKLRGYAASKNIRASLAAKEILLEGMRSLGMIPPWYTLQHMREKL